MRKGQENLIPIRSREEAQEKGRKGGLAAAKANRERAALVEVVRERLFQVDKKGKTMMERVVASVLKRAEKSGDMADLERLQKILGEAKQTLEVKMPQITVKSDEDAKLIAELMEGDN